MTEAVQTFGRKRTATAVAHCKRGNGLIKLNGSPLDLVQPEILKTKVLLVNTTDENKAFFLINDSKKLKK